VPIVADTTAIAKASDLLIRFVKQQLWVAVFIVGLTLLCRGIINAVFDIGLNHDYWLRDLAGNWVVALIIFALLQSLKKSLILAGFIIVFFQMSNALKLVILGTPASPDDFFNVQNLFYLTEGWRRWLMIAVVAFPLLLAVLFVPWRKPSFWLAIVLLAFTGFGLAHNSESVRHYLDSRYGNSVWNQPANYKSRGLGLHLAQETVRTISKIGKIPKRSEVDKALTSLEQQGTKEIRSEPSLLSVVTPASAADSSVGNARNLHVFVLESFFDPLSLGSEWVPEDPFPESFRALWAETGHTKALSPVFGGYTANAEFEVLCGFPVTRNAVFFEGWLRRQVPCLPAVLSEKGYSSIASHPNVPGFWNRTHAYHLVGFEHYLSKAHFDMTTSVAGLLLDRSMYEQIFSRLSRGDYAEPVFNYMLTYHGHLPYPSSDDYPDQIKAGQESKLLHGYLNQMWYKSRDLMQRIERLRKEDPDALIVIFGDHLPFLGPNYAIYTEAWELPENRDQFSGKQLEMLTSTPLIVIDGQRGPLPLGKLPLYRLPSLILTLLGLENTPSMFNLSLNPEDSWVRPVYGMHINVEEHDSHACTDQLEDSDSCAQTSDWLKRTELFIRDIFTGNQFTLDNIGQSAELPN
jgi:phosphoglycerol transferase MdoB-like AlkP superfamily enzyme